MIYAIVLFGLDIVVGYTGQVSLGHAGLFGIGAYTAGVLILKLDAPVYATLPAAIAVAAVFGAMLALPALRVTGPYLAMVTLAFGTIIQILINEMSFLTEGPMGITLTKPALFGHPLDEMQFYWLVMACLVAALVFVHRVLHSQLGRAFEALRGSPVASDCMGVSVYRYKVYAFVISAALAGLAGSLYAYSEQYISPNTYNFELTVMFLLAIIMGGRKTRTGALLGAAIIVMLPKLLDDLEVFRIGAVVLAVMVALSVAVGLKRGKLTRQAAIPVLQKQPELFAPLRERFFSREHDPRDLPLADKASIWVGMGMTEKQGGSDLRRVQTTAVEQADGSYAISGHKWFFSAPGSDAHLVLARTDAGPTCFWLPRHTPDGARNAVQVMRLKDKLGNRSNASGEVEFHGAWAQRLGDEGRGIPTLIEMAGYTRLNCVIGSAALLRAGFVQALHNARERSAFGRLLAEQPLMQTVLADLALESEAAMRLMLRLARGFEHAVLDLGRLGQCDGAGRTARRGPRTGRGAGPARRLRRQPRRAGQGRGPGAAPAADGRPRRAGAPGPPRRPGPGAVRAGAADARAVVDGRGRCLRRDALRRRWPAAGHDGRAAGGADPGRGPVGLIRQPGGAPPD